MPKPKKDEPKPEDERTPEETERIREATLKRILDTPPKKHVDMISERRAKPRRKAKRGE